MPNNAKMYNTNNFIQDMRRRMLAHDIVMTEADTKLVYRAVFETLQHALVHYGTYSLPFVCQLSLRQSKARQFTVRSFGPDQKNGERRTVLSCAFRITAKMNRGLTDMLHQAKELPSNDKRLQRALDAISSDDE